MSNMDQLLLKALQLAATMVEWEFEKRRRLNPSCNPDELWASVTHDAHILVGTPLLHRGEGYYVDREGNWWAA